MVSKWEEWKDSLAEGANPCYKCQGKGNDRSGNNFHFYGEGLGGYCFACEYTIPSEDVLRSKDSTSGSVEDSDNWELNTMAKSMSISEWKELKKNCNVDPKGYRCLSKKACEAYGVRHEYDEETGKVKRQYYPNTKGYKYSGVKARLEPKGFLAFGGISNDCDLFGQWRFRNSNSKVVVITAGEMDCLSGWKILNENRKEGYEETPTVSPVNGESGAHKQLQKQYEWLNKFDKIILCFDNDDAGREAIERCVKVLPKGKTHTMSLSLKDTNEYLTKGREREWINAFWKAEKATPAGVVPSSGIYDLLLNRAETDKVTLPAFMSKMQDMMCGGLPLKSIINITAGSGSGKTSFINEFVLHFIFNTNYRVGVCSLEADVAEYGENILSRHIGRKIALIRDKQDKINFIRSDEVKSKAKHLFTCEDGNPRFYLNDDRGDFDSLTDKIEQMVIQCGVQIVVIDPASDAIAGFSNEEVELFMQWQKKLTKSHDVCILNIMHSTKKLSGNGPSASQGGMPSEENIIGHSSQYKSASANIILVRNKLAENESDRNTTQVYLSKCRWSGNTGLATEVYYEPETHTLHDKEQYMEGKKPFRGF